MAKKKGGAPKGSKNALKCKDVEARQEAFKAYCYHLSAGFSGSSFHTPCVEDTIKNYLRNYPKEFDLNALSRAKAMGRHVWEDIGKRGTMGALKGFNALSWKCNMFNRLGWKDRQEHGFDENMRAVFKVSMGRDLGKPKDEDESDV